MSERETALKEVPLAIRHEAQRCAVQNGRIDPEYLIGLWRRGAEFRTVVDHNGEILTQAAVDRLLSALPPGDAPQTCPHCKLPAVMPEVCTPEINAVIEDSIEQDWALLNKGVEIGKALAAPVDAPQTCEWRGDVGNGYYNTGCEVATDYFEDAPTSTAIGWKFCPYCGKPLTLAQEEPIRPPVEGQTP